MAKWIEVGTKSDFPQGDPVNITVDQRNLVVCNVGGELCAVENVCPHAGMPIGQGELRGAALTCPFHGYTYDVRTGRNVDFDDDEPLGRHPLRVTDDGRIEVDIETKS